jgi:hypothetical protein
MKRFSVKASPSCCLALGEQFLDLDLADQVARSVAGLLEVEVLLGADEVAVHAEPVRGVWAQAKAEACSRVIVLACMRSSPRARAARSATRM